MVLKSNKDFSSNIYHEFIDDLLFCNNVVNIIWWLLCEVKDKFEKSYVVQRAFAIFVLEKRENTFILIKSLLNFAWTLNL